MKNYSSLLTLFYLFSACSNTQDPDKIIDKSVAYYHMDKLKNSSLEFVFRKAKFKAMQKDGQFK